MILRLEHVEDVRPERLRRLDDVGTRRIGLARRPGTPRVARCTVMPVLISVLTNFVAVRKSGWSAGRM